MRKMNQLIIEGVVEAEESDYGTEFNLAYEGAVKRESFPLWDPANIWDFADKERDTVRVVGRLGSDMLGSIYIIPEHVETVEKYDNTVGYEAE